MLAPADGVVPFLAETVLNITPLPGIQIIRFEESTQNTRRGSAGRPSRSTDSRTSGDCSRDRASRRAHNCTPCGLPGELLAPRPRSGLPSLLDAIIDIPLHGLRRHLLEVLIGRQNRALSRTCQAGKNNRKT